MNKVIIPDEKVRIKTKEAQLVREALNMSLAARSETARTDIAIVEGLIDWAAFSKAIRASDVKFPDWALLIYKINVSMNLKEFFFLRV